ncbi:TetR/AcrR family transcriptional regulator C-terminal domain-containing protein [Streptacidiphilus sp. N1-12]|uniref:TetR/AcrR family transcriptional regulator C-terminal domain-containing protein n=2 Tax=Streptacidiphilus alkalitolerans TaxID=3342712 RepID=A0ABV6WFB3_9ACTN
MARPRKALLDLERITQAALDLVDETGDFTVPAMARRLGVQTASIYHHVDGRSGIVELLRVRLGTRIEAVPVEGQSWEPALRAFAYSYRAAFAAHPHLVPLLTGAPVQAPEVLATYERIVVLLESAGFPLEVIMTALTAFENFVLGAALDLAAPEVMWAVPDGVRAPRLAAALAAQPTATGRADRAFDFGVTVLVEGFRALLAQARQPAGPDGTQAAVGS